LILEMQSRRLRYASRQQIEFGAFDSTGRVARRLIELAERFGEDVGGGIKINLSLSQQELAGWTGSSREAVSKALQSLRSRDLIETHRRGITILDMEGLRKRAT
ncbi:MAG: Crp/Fnr family transcriptional regulator, partial [Acidimicrobiia bacterium]